MLPLLRLSAFYGGFDLDEQSDHVFCPEGAFFGEGDQLPQVMGIAQRMFTAILSIGAPGVMDCRARKRRQNPRRIAAFLASASTGQNEVRR